MLAMDVVDTLRHEQLLVERELASDERDQALIEKVKRMYASQGLEVTDDVIAAGVAALKENRFAYQPPPPRGSAWLASLYVSRNRLAKWAAILAGPGAWPVFFLPVRFCGARKFGNGIRAAKDINTLIGQQQDQLSVAKQRLANLNQALNQRQEKSSTAPKLAGKRSVSGGRAGFGRSRDQIAGLGQTAPATQPDRGQSGPGRRRQ